MPGHDPYVKHVQVRPCDSSRVGATRVNIAGYDFELIEPVRPADRPVSSAAGADAPRRPNNPDVVAPKPFDPGSQMVRHSPPAQPVTAYEGAYEDDDEGDPSGGGAGVDLATVHRVMRGKYILAIFLGLIFAGVGVYFGIKLGHPNYQSTGLIHVVSQSYIYDTPEHRNTPFLEMIRSFAAKLTTQQMIRVAMDTPPWRGRDHKRQDETEGEFAKNLTVTQEGQLLFVRYTDQDRDHAKAAVDAILAAFQTWFDAEQTTRTRDTLQALTAHRDKLASDLRTTRENIAAIAEEFGPAGLKAQRDYLAVELRRIDILTGDLNVGESPALLTESATLSDRYLQTLEDRRFEQKSRLAQLDAAGVGVNMKQHQEAVALLKTIEDQIEDRRKEIAAETGSTVGDGLSPTSQPASALEARKARLRDRRSEIDKDMKAASKKIAEIEGMLIVEARTQHDLDTAEESLRQRQLEEHTFQLDTTDADVPQFPSRDTRVGYAAGGGIGGLVLGIGLMALIGLMDRRVLDPNDTMNKGRRHPILGMLPQLPADLSDPEETAVAAHAVHEIRNRLQMAGGGGMQRVFAVTGSVAGSGKTSLTLGLGVSFAAGGFRTLVVDADLVGGGLSSRVNAIARRKVGQLLLKEGLVTPQQLEDALLRGRASGRRIGEMLVQLGYVDEADLLSALERQSHSPVGILDALAGEALSECAVATGIDNLWAIPLGGATPADAGVVSGTAMQGFIDRARQQFDVILLDSGPVPGSTEAAIAAAHADAVVLVVARGDTRPYVERSIKYLKELQVKFAGLVFNRAKKRDIERYGSSRVSNVDSATPQRMVPVNVPGTDRFGPIPRCVVSRTVKPGDEFRSN
jgi:Mrp family chromosome partitioning ATPase